MYKCQRANIFAQSKASLVCKVLPRYQLLFHTTWSPSGLITKLKYSLLSFVVRRHEHGTAELYWGNRQMTQEWWERGLSKLPPNAHSCIPFQPFMVYTDQPQALVTFKVIVCLALPPFAWRVAWLTPLKTKRRPLYLKTQSVPRCKHFSSRL